MAWNMSLLMQFYQTFSSKTVMSLKQRQRHWQHNLKKWLQILMSLALVLAKVAIIIAPRYTTWRKQVTVFIFE
jgi:hypothetical protein